MNAEESAPGGAWTVRLRVWVERDGRAVLGPGRLELLEGIDRHHSISAAARAMGMSYRHAWLLGLCNAFDFKPLNAFHLGQIRCAGCIGKTTAVRPSSFGSSFQKIGTMPSVSCS